ncbi:hypothetical protein SLEP1_g48271 [Rubroshorea leprosula]|uniref:Uncharacterized protein n=1 Tax=Rubroshorea leprosula TaxID=152421 RepID=A0AAV5LW38_9ROSI|nr:hypothetical protein SLEP1_g48271 [Rubroshorea leprosula]
MVAGGLLGDGCRLLCNGKRRARSRICMKKERGNRRKREAKGRVEGEEEIQEVLGMEGKLSRRLKGRFGR